MFFYGQKPDLKPNLKLHHLVLMGISGALGAGFFVLISESIIIGGKLVPLSFLVVAIASFLMSRIYAELATSMPVSGGGQVYLRNAFSYSPFIFVIHWLTWLAEMAFTALNALGAGYYISLLIPVNPIAISLFCIVLLVLINLRGVDKVGVIEIITGVLMLFGIGILFFWLFQHIPSDVNFFSQTSFAGAFGWLYAIPLVFVIFIGNEDVAAIAEEVKDKKDIAKAFTLVIIGISIITVLFSFLFSQIFTESQLLNTNSPFELIGELIGPVGRLLGIVVAILGCVSSFFFGSLADTRTAYAMAKAGEFPKMFTKLNKYKVPVVSVLVSGVIVTFLVLTRSASYIAYLASAGFLIEVIAITLAMMKLRKKRPHLPRPYIVKLYPLIPILVIIISIFFLLFVELQTWGLIIMFSILGFLVHIINNIKKERWYWALLGLFSFIFLVAIITALLISF